VNVRIIALIVILALIGGIGVFVYHRQSSPRAEKEKLVEQFIAILPDSLDNDHILEIRKLFYTLYEREKLGKVKPETSEAITNKMAAFVEKGRINAKDLIYFMAEVGYSTYKDEPKYNLSDGSNDNPILNPKSSTYSLNDTMPHDSAFWAGFEQWKKEHPEYSDSTFWQDSIPEERRPGGR
jgi:hypothetical protein